MSVAHHAAFACLAVPQARGLAALQARLVDRIKRAAILQLHASPGGERLLLRLYLDGEEASQRILQDRLFNHPKVEVVWNAALHEVKGEDNPPKVKAVVLKDVETGAFHERPADGVFIAIGHAPATELIHGQLKLKPSGYVWTQPDSTMTSVEGVFAAGDVADDVFRQAVTAAGMGCMAALEAERFIASRQQLAHAAE